MITIYVACAIGGIAIGIIVGILIRKKVAESKIGSATLQANRILEEAIRNAEARKKESLIEAKGEIIRAKDEAEAEIKERRREVSRQERRIAQKEESPP